MLKTPEKYLSSILSAIGKDKDINHIIRHFIKTCDKDLHFIIDEKELRLSDIICDICFDSKSTNTSFTLEIEQKVISIKLLDHILRITSLEPQLVLQDIVDETYTITTRPQKINEYIPLSNCSITQKGTIKKRILEYKEYFCAKSQCDFFSNEKLLVVGNKNLFSSIPKEYPSCFVFEKDNGDIEIEYNSPLLPKISVIKSINLLDRYLQHEINGKNIIFFNCIFVGRSKFEHSMTTIRKYYNERILTRVIFIGEKDVKINLGINQIPLRWKWTIPEIRYLKNEKCPIPEYIVIYNEEFESAITEFHRVIKNIQIKHTIGLKSIFRYIRRLYYDWNLKEETTIRKLSEIQNEFEVALKQLLIETLGNIDDPDLDFDEYQQPLSVKYSEIINAVKSNNKTEKIKNYRQVIHQLIVPSFLCNTNNNELNQIYKSIGHNVKVHDFSGILKLDEMRRQNINNPQRKYYALTSNKTKTEILSFAKSDDNNKKYNKVVSSIYGSGEVEKLIERLGNAKTAYKLLLYNVEEKALLYHKDKYHEALNREYASSDRYEICGVEFNDPFYQFSTFDEWLEDLTTDKHDIKEAENYKFTFSDNSKARLPATKSVLKIVADEKFIVLVEDLNIGDKVRIYENPDKEMLRTIFELKNPELKKIADEYSYLWENCLKEADQQYESLYKQLKQNGFSVSEFTFRKYLHGEIMFPRSFSDLIIIAKTIDDERLTFDFLKNTMKPKIEEYRGKEIEYGFKFSNSINHFIIAGEIDEFISEWMDKKEIVDIVSKMPIKTVKEIDLLTKQNDDE